MAQVLWPVRELQLASGPVFFLQGLEDHRPGLTYAPFLELDAWAVIPTTVVSPVHVFLLNKRKAPKQSGACWQASGPQQGIMPWAAEHCFWKLGLPALHRLMRHEGLAVKRGTTQVQVLEALVRHFLPEVSDARLHAILALRGQQPPNLLSDLSPERVDDCCGKAGKQDVQEQLVRLFSDSTH